MKWPGLKHTLASLAVTRACAVKCFIIVYIVCADLTLLGYNREYEDLRMRYQNAELWQTQEALSQIRPAVEEIESKLAELPEIMSMHQVDCFGYHGGYLPQLQQLPERPRWSVELFFFDDNEITDLYLIPAIDTRYGEIQSFGFPKRFRVTVQTKQSTYEPIFESIQSDCVDPGRNPFHIKLPAKLRDSNSVRIEVFKGSIETRGQECFALSEIMVANKLRMLYATRVSVSNSYESKPYWSSEFLTDQRTSLGLPLKNNEFTDRKTELIATFDDVSENKLEIEVDLGKDQPVDFLVLFPALAPEGELIPGFGFPKSLEIQYLSQSGSSESAQVSWENEGLGNNVARFRLPAFPIRWIKLTLGDLPVHNGEVTFGMGEIAVYHKNRAVQVEGIRLIHFPESVQRKSKRLIDRKVSGHPIRPFRSWIGLIEQRNILRASRDALLQLESKLVERWNNFQRNLVTSLIILVFIASSLCIIYLRIQRRLEAKKLRLQIGADLHDDFGSKIAAVQLLAQLVKRHSRDEQATTAAAQISSVAEGMHRALSDALWIMSSDTDQLSTLFDKLENIATTMVTESKLVLNRPPADQVPNMRLRPQYKRNLTLILREALHNALKHSEAETIHVSLSLIKNEFSMRIQDNGCGFSVDLEKGPQDGLHIGLDSMRRRAQELKGELLVNSDTGSGTTIELLVTL